MKIKNLLIAGAFLLTLSAWGQTPGQKQRLHDHLYYFASDEMRGRKAGSEDSRKAADYIRNQFEQMGLESYYEEWYQDFYVEDTEYRNVVAFIEGSDPKLKNEYVVIGAHFDHLGINKKGEVYNGADDNASGSSALIEIARQLSSSRKDLKRSVIICGFDGEELGLYGSRQLAKRLAAEGIKIKLMISVDMVGWYKANKYLELEGVGTIADGLDFVYRGSSELGINLRTTDFEASVFTATDTEYFAKNGVPTLAITTGTKSPYHKTSDDADLIDFDGLDKITDYVALLVSEAAGDPEFAASGEVAPKHRSARVRGNGLSVALTGMSGNSYIDFKDAAFVGRESDAFSVGATVRYDMGYFGARMSALFEKNKALYPDSNDYLSSKVQYQQTAITLPAEFLLQLPGFGFLGIGPYYSHVLASKNADFSANGKQWGLSFSWGIELGHFDFGYTARRGWGNLFTGADAPATSLVTSGLVISYRF